MQEIIDYLQGKGNIIFFDWNNPNIDDFLLLVVYNFTGDGFELESVIENNYTIEYFDLVDGVVKTEFK